MAETLHEFRHLLIQGARTHNLRNVTVKIPHDQLVVITGPSGSGKSSLAFDTIFAEGQRQYFESLSTYARQFLDQLPRPDVDLVSGLRPTIAVEQRADPPNPRSTVATVTEIYDYLRVLMARVGEVTCYQCGEPIRQQSDEQIFKELIALPEGTKVMLLAPLVRGRKGQHAEAFAAARQAGMARVRVDGVVYDLDQTPALVKQKHHDIEGVVDRIILRAGIESRLRDSMRLALRHGEGVVIATCWRPGDPADTWRDVLFNTEYCCPTCKISFAELEPRTFSFNSPYGACPTCEGLGARRQFDPDLVLSDAARSLSGGAVAPWRNDKGKLDRKRTKDVHALAIAAEVHIDLPLAELTARERERLWHGDGKQFAGLAALLEAEFRAANGEDTHQWETYRDDIPCHDCGGSRLRPEARSVRLGGRAIHEISALTVSDAQPFFRGLSLRPEELAIAERSIAEIVSRLEFLNQVGLSYLTLDRAADTLSGGEAQRVRLATGIGAGLIGICYVLDEPSIGLHPRDSARLLSALRSLQQQGNSVLVVEHDESLMRAADWLIDLGPGAGQHGGQITAEGSPQHVAAGPSLTGQYLSGRKQIALPASRRAIDRRRMLVLEGAAAHNLRQVTLELPLGVLTCVTGVSGSGKSTLINDTLAPAVARSLGQSAPKPGPFTALRGAKQIDKLVVVDQSPIGRTPRSNPATYLGIFDEVRKVFAHTRESRTRGYGLGRFSFNVAGGRCEECLGQGQKKLEMQFLPDLFVTCPVCLGARFNRQTLEIRYRDRSIADVLQMRADEAHTFFENFPTLSRLLGTMVDVGLGYVTLGQASNTLSGGEAQRLRLAAELSRVDTGQTLYVLDEPTTGLHLDDIRRLLEILQRLVDRGNTMVVIEHHLDVMAAADWMVDLGPEGGAAGGQIVAVGTPEDVSTCATSQTAPWLRERLTAPAYLLPPRP